MDEETLDEILNGRLRVFQKKRGYRFSVDAVLLAHFICLKAKSKAIDLGTGSGIIPMLLATRFPLASWTGLEIQEGLAKLAARSVALNGLQERISIVHGDARKIKSLFPALSFDAVTFNPPYRKINSGRVNPDQEKAIARHEIKGSLKYFLQAASYLLKPGGKVFSIYPAKRMIELVACFRAASIEPKRMKFVFSDEKSGAAFVLTEGRIGSREELKIESSLFIYDENKKYTDQMKGIFSDLA
ncbi:MAG: tRNA1(Val) (adenine(37)-N6)-methyltransferase [Smithellaceae bacterium]